MAHYIDYTILSFPAKVKVSTSGGELSKPLKKEMESLVYFFPGRRLQSGAIGYRDLILECFGHIPHAGLHKRIQAVEHWSGPDQAVLHTVSVHLRSRFADRVWDDAPPGYLAALYLLASKERLWQPALPALSHDSIDFSRIVSKPHGFAIQDYPIFYSARRLYDLKSPMEAEDLAHPKLVSDLDFHNIIYATMIARYGKAVMDASKEAPEWAMC